MREKWKDIDGFEDYYQVSNHGRVRSKERTYVVVKNGRIISKTNKAKVRKSHPNNKGYLRLGLRINGVTKNFSVHRLVAEAFISNPENKPMVNHKDGDKQNNYVRNLEWTTHIENDKHAIQNNLKGNKMILQLDMFGNVVDDFISLKSGSEKTGINITGISLCCNNKQISAGGFMWKFKRIEEAKSQPLMRMPL